MTTTSDSFRQIQLWSQYHRALGVELFYLFVDGQVRKVRRPGHCNMRRKPANRCKSTSIKCPNVS